MRRRSSRGAAQALALTAALFLAACEQTAAPGGQPQAADAPEAQYLTEAVHFRALQMAGLSGDYRKFASHLPAEQPETVVAELMRSFGGRPFDVYTWKTKETPSGHARLIELRGRSGRLYLFVQLDRVPGGWHLAAYDLSRNRTSVTSRL